MKFFVTVFTFFWTNSLGETKGMSYRFKFKNSKYLLAFKIFVLWYKKIRGHFVVYFLLTENKQNKNWKEGHDIFYNLRMKKCDFFYFCKGRSQDNSEILRLDFKDWSHSYPMTSSSCFISVTCSPGDIVVHRWMLSGVAHKFKCACRASLVTSEGKARCGIRQGASVNKFLYQRSRGPRREFNYPHKLAKQFTECYGD